MRKVLGSFIGIAIINSFAPAALSNEYLPVYTKCRAETDNIILYDFGKRIAEGAKLYKASSSQAKFPPRTKKDFIVNAVTKYQAKNKILDEGSSKAFYTCEMGYWSTAVKMPWSSVHQGLYDYLPQSEKTKFLSLPER